MDLLTAKHINHLLNYGLNKAIFSIDELDDVRQKMAQLFSYNGLSFSVDSTEMSFEDMMNPILDYAFKLRLFSLNTLSERDAFEAKIMDAMMPEPSIVKSKFKALYQVSPDQATAYLYDLSKAVNYIKVNRLKQNKAWQYISPFGILDLTINLAKPEKDPKDIARQKNVSQDHIKDQPLCVLCKENEQNYYNARMNLRIVPITLGNELWHFQYSPYLYYHEHAIILHDTHRPMNICDQTVDYLIDFVDHFPNYFIGSNADLPIVGGSILSHDHFQAGKHTFPIEHATSLYTFELEDDDIELSILKWPLSTLRIKTNNVLRLKRYAKRIIALWKTYSDPTLNILAHTNDTPHHTVTPILRKKGHAYEMDLIFRNNMTTDQYPLGLFHPHEDVWHIKKENIGLIEAMGLAILPGRLKSELERMIDLHQHNQAILPKDLKHHQDWYEMLKASYQSLTIKDVELEVGKKFETVLYHAGVFKQDRQGLKGFKSFVFESLYYINSKKHID